MNKLLSKIRQIENTLNLGEMHVTVMKFIFEPEDEALARHLKSNPQDAGKEYSFITNYGTEDYFLGTYEEMIFDLQDREERRKAEEESQANLSGSN